MGKLLTIALLGGTFLVARAAQRKHLPWVFEVPASIVWGAGMWYWLVESDTRTAFGLACVQAAIFCAYKAWTELSKMWR